MTDTVDIGRIKFDIEIDGQGLTPAIVQDVKTGAVLMLAYMNKEALEQTIKTGKATYYSRSRKQLWVKGETSGNTQYVEAIRYDCDADTLLLRVRQKGAACHTGEYTCFHNTLVQNTVDAVRGGSVIQELFDVIEDRAKNPREGSYTNYLLDKGLDKILKKVGEESAEVIIAAKNQSPDELRYESADLIYHLLVLLSHQGMKPDDLFAELESRRK